MQRYRVMASVHGSEGTTTDQHRLEERVAHLERRLDALEETVRSLALDLRQLFEASDTDDELA